MIVKDPTSPENRAPAILFASPYSPVAVGGVGQFLIDVGSHLVAEGFPVGFLYVEETAEMDLPGPLLSSDRLEISTRGSRVLGTALGLLRTIRRMLSTRDRFTLCHALVPRPLTAIAVALARVLGQRAVATVFAPYPRAPNPLEEAAQRIAERVTLAMADEVVYECEATRRVFPRKGVVIYNGIDTTYYGPDEKRRREFRSRLGVSPETIVFLYAGRVTELKGIRDLTEAFQGLDSSLLEKALLVLVGPVETTDLDTLLPPDMPFPDRIRLVPPVGKYEIRDYYQAADVFVLPSYWEGISSALVEAMACGLPVLVSNAGGSPEVVAHGRSGFLHDPGDVEGLRTRLKEMIERPDLRRSMGREARSRIETTFSIQTMARRYREVYGRVLGLETLAPSPGPQPS